MASLACEPKELRKNIKKSQVMVLAAGLGTRLRPLTNYIPKPLFPILNRPILGRILDRLLPYFSNIVINTYHLSDHIYSFINKNFANTRVSLIKEPQLLGTAGALKYAFKLGLLNKDSPLLVYNSDIITDFNPILLYKYHIEVSRKYGVLATLLLHNYSKFNNILCNSSNKIIAFRINNPKCLAYTGIMVIEPEFIKSFIKDSPCDIIDIFSNAIRHGIKIKGVNITQLVNNYIWQDIGTINGYLHAHKLLLTSKNKKIFIPAQLKSNKIKLIDWVCIGNNVIFNNKILLEIKRSVIWPNTKIDDNLKKIEDMLVTNIGILKLK